MEGSVPIAGLAILPWVFPTLKDCFAAMDGPFGKTLRAAIVKSGLYVFERTWNGSFRQMSNSARPIRHPDDLKALKVRVGPSPMELNTFKALGAAPAPIANGLLYSALQTHLVDGATQPLGTFDALKLYDVQKYVSLINWSWTGYGFAANPDAWQRLPRNLRDIVERNMERAALAERVELPRVEEALLQTLPNKGDVEN